MLTIMTERNSDLATLGQKSVNTNSQHNSMSWTACYNDTCQTHQSDKNDFRWYSKPRRQNLHTTQVKRHVDSLYSRSDSEKSYKVVEFSETEQES